MKFSNLDLRTKQISRATSRSNEVRFKNFWFPKETSRSNLYLDLLKLDLRTFGSPNKYLDL